MAMAGYVLDMPTKTDYYLGLIAGAKGSSAVVEAVQRYLASWSNERIANLQKIDAGWAPFDERQRPLEVSGVLDVRCICDAIHCHCAALRQAGVALTPELVELDKFFFVARDRVENLGPVPVQVRAPASPSHLDVFATC